MMHETCRPRLFLPQWMKELNHIEKIDTIHTRERVQSCNRSFHNKTAN